MQNKNLVTVAGTIYDQKKTGWKRVSPKPLSKDRKRQAKNNRIKLNARNLLDVSAAFSQASKEHGELGDNVK